MIPVGASTNGGRGAITDCPITIVVVVRYLIPVTQRAGFKVTCYALIGRLTSSTRAEADVINGDVGI